MSDKKYQASTIVKYSPRKTRLIINVVRGKKLDDAFVTLRNMNKGKSKKIHDLLNSAAANLKIEPAEHKSYIVKTIVAEEAYKLIRVVPRARGSAFRIRRRYARVKVSLDKV
jgi:large subunit ribosomal protein L22